MTIASLLEDARRQIAVDDEELLEAKRRRGLVAEALRDEFRGARIYFNGSVAHGDANDPLTDFDMGVVVPNPNSEFGPGRKSAAELKRRAAAAIGAALRDEFPKLRLEQEGRKRSVLVRFSDPVTPRADDFTGDVICAVDHSERGLWIPRHDGWDRSHPEEHTRLVKAANARTAVMYARTIRLLKHWSGHHGDPLCSWHLKALALAPLRRPQPLIEALEAFFVHSGEAVASGPTPDPAHVGRGILSLIAPEDAVGRLQTALDHVRTATSAEHQGFPCRAQAELASLLPDIVPAPPQSALADEDRRREVARLVGGSATGVGPGSTVVLPGNRGWGHG